MINLNKKKSIISLFLFFFIFSIRIFSEEIMAKENIVIKEIKVEEDKGIVSLSPSITETLFYFGYGDRVVGRTDYCNYPEETKKIPSMGTMFAPNIESILLENPKFIIEQTHFDEKRERLFNSMGIKTLSLKTPKTMEDILNSYKKIIEFLDDDQVEREKKLEKLKEMERIVKKIKLQGESVEKHPKIYYSLGGGHTEYTAGKESFIDEAITLAGGENIVKDKGWTYSLEGLLYSQPDIIILSEKRYKEMLSNEKYNDLKVLKDKKRVILAEESEITLPTPRLLLETLNKIQKTILDFNSI